MNNQSFGTCSGCGKQIIWTKMNSGKNMPCDPEVIWFTSAGGPETFITPYGKIVRGKRDRDGKEMGYVPHWATCPARDRFKKEKKE